MIIQKLCKAFQLPILCKLAGVSRSGFYKFLGVQSVGISNADKELIAQMQDIQKESNGIYGYRRMKLAIEKLTGKIINKKRIARLQKTARLQAKIRRRRFKYPIIQFACESPKPNILNREFTAIGPNQKWVTDITYIFNGGQRYYLSVIMDLYGREIIAWKLSKTIDLPFVLETVSMAFQKRIPGKVLIHSDQGGQYTSRIYCELLRNHGAIQSMSRRGNCWDNAVMENFFGHLKVECIRRLQPCGANDLEKSIEKYLEFYNCRRIQTKIKMAPVEYRSHFLHTA